MAFGLYTLLEAALLCINAIAILNEERFLSKGELPLFFTSVVHFMQTHIWDLVSCRPISFPSDK